MRILLLFLISVTIAANAATAQVSDSSLTAVTKLPSVYFKQVEKKSAQLENKITARSEKALQQFSKRILAQVCEVVVGIMLGTSTQRFNAMLHTCTS